MPGTRKIALDRGMCNGEAGSAPLRLGLILFGATLLSAPGSPARAQRLPLPPEEQAAVDRAIERGVKFLKNSAQKNGSWAQFPAPHPFGYAALPGLTLLECGVSPDDPLLQRTAHCLRQSAANLNETYELSLAILFLDRLGDPKDSKLIQTFALRLVAGQSATGGWGYKCPILGPHVEQDLLTVLRHLNPPSPGGMPGIAAGPPAVLKPKEAELDNAKPAEDNEAKPFVIPERLLRLAVVQDPDTHVLADPPRKSHDLFLTTTDNSNTQFAILALWTAQRHGVPMVRSLNLIVRRYQTSQNADGSWGYHYRLGGGQPWGPAMTCVGLIGLAVGHGLRNHGPGGKPVQDPRILNGLVALSRAVGTPTGQLRNLPMQNLYFLWSLERVAVLYNLPKIGDKDWYRWGAEVLVANQGFNGNWARGNYPGSHPTIDTCLALLFLKRANLVKDLTSRLPFNPADLNKSVLELLMPAAPPAETPRQPLQTTTPSVESSKPAAPPPRDDSTPKPPAVLDAIPAPRASETSADVAPVESPSGESKKKWVLLSLALFVVLAGGSLFFLLASRRTKDDDLGKKVKGSNGKRKSAARK